MKKIISTTILIRFKNYVLDTTIIVFLYFLSFVVLFKAVGHLKLLNLPMVRLLYFLFPAIYYFCFEVVYAKTPGKMFTKSNVVNKYGGRPSITQIFLRSMIRLIPIYPLWFLAGEIGLQDRMSDTRVVRSSPHPN